MQADFYLINQPRFRDHPLLLVCKLVQKANAANLATLVLARDDPQADELDDLLWSFDPDADIPHQIAGRDPEDDADVPVLIVPPAVDVPARPLIVNLRDAAVAGECQRVLEVVAADPAARAGSRERWRQYRARGIAVQKHDM